MAQSAQPVSLPKSLPMPPETDSSGESVRLPSMQRQPTNLYNSGVLPELTLGPPQRNTQKSNQIVLPAAGVTIAQATPITAYQQVTSKPANSRVPQTPLHWETVVVESKPAPPVTPALTTPPASPLTVIEKLAPIRTKIDPLSRTTQSPPPVKTPKTYLNPTPGQLTSTIIEEEEVRPATVQFFSLSYNLMAGCLFFLSLIATSLLYLLDLASGGTTITPLPHIFLRSNWGTFLIPLSLSFGGLGYYLTSQSLRRGTRNSWWGGLGVGFHFPLVIFFLNKLFWNPVRVFFDNPQLVSRFTYLDGLDARFLLPLFSIPLIFIIPTILLLFFIKSFHFTIKQTAQNIPWLKLAFSVIILGPSIGYGGYSAFTSLDNNLHFAEIKQMAGFPIIRPLEIPQGWEQVSYFSINQSPTSLLLGRDDFMEVSFDRSINRRLQGEASVPMVLREIDVPASFNLTDFASKVIEGARVTPISVQRAQSQQAYLIENPEGEKFVRALTFTTSDHILILISSRDAAVTELVNLANSLN